MAKNTRTKIVEKAENLLRLQGYQATSLNDVVNKAGVSKGAFFHYYPNKQAISEDVLNKYAAEQLIGPLQAALENAGSVKEGLFNWAESYFNAFRQSGFKGGCLLGNMALELSDQNDAARDTIKGHFLELENTLCRALKPLEAQGKLLMEARQLARLFISSFQGIAMMMKVHKDSNRASREYMALAGLIEYMIKD